MKILKFLVLASILAAAPACKKKQQDQPGPASGSVMGSGAEPGSATGSAPGSADPGSGTMAGSGSADATAEADYVTVLAEHAEKKPTDPVEVHFDKFKVTEATFDPKKVEGGTATLEVDLTSLRTGSDKRDKHLTSAAYLDVGKFATLTIKISNVKKVDGEKYSADAKVNLHGVDKTYPVAFEVVESGDSWIRIKGEHELPRLDFKIGAEPNPDESVAEKLLVKLQLKVEAT